MNDKARKEAIAADKKINAYVAELKAVEAALLPPDSRMRAELSKIKPDLVATIDMASAAFLQRRNDLAIAIDAGQADKLPSGDLKMPEDALAAAITDIEEQENDLMDGKFDELITKLKVEHIKLRQRQVLSKNITDVVTFVEDLEWIEKARRAKPTTRFITTKQRTLFQTLIEGEYKKRLEEECEKLGFTLPIEFKARGSAGKTLRGLKVQGGHNPEDIFSEGEQRALALADFLTEANLNPASSAIIFDDPVTSLDHQRKELIAIRLGQEAQSRQVVVFTHDLVFLSKLLNVAERASLDAICHTIDWYNGRPGYVINNESPLNSLAYRDTRRAKEYLYLAKSKAGRKKVDFVRHGAGALRKTIEEVVILHMFKGVVRRWNEDVRLGRVAAINWSNDLADEVEDMLDGTSRLIEAHSNSDEFGGGMPDIPALEGLVTRVDEFIKKVKPERLKIKK